VRGEWKERESDEGSSRKAEGSWLSWFGLVGPGLVGIDGRRKGIGRGWWWWWWWWW